MRRVGIIALVCFVFIGCSNSTDSLSKKALELMFSENYSLKGTSSLDKIKVLKSELINSDLNSKYYRCLGLIKLKHNADRTYQSDQGVINPGEAYYGMEYVKLEFKQGPTGNVEIVSFDTRSVPSKDGAEVTIR